VTGTVAYRERIALPADAVVEIRLSDVSRQDVASPVIAETTVRPAGRQVPIPFELRYDAGKIDPNRTYAVRATISSAGRMMFTTATAYPVITRGNPTQINLMLQRVVAAPGGGSRPM
jgi:putative lipoprotein